MVSVLSDVCLVSLAWKILNAIFMDESFSSAKRYQTQNQWCWSVWKPVDEYIQTIPEINEPKLVSKVGSVGYWILSAWLTHWFALCPVQNKTQY
jgi:hypothetical protein